MASKRRQRRNACSGKQRHADQTAAVRHIISLKRTGDIGYVRSYRCRFCSGWHVGHFAPRRS